MDQINVIRDTMHSEFEFKSLVLFIFIYQVYDAIYILSLKNQLRVFENH